MKPSAISTWGGLGVVAALLAAGLWWASARTPAPEPQPAPTASATPAAKPASTITSAAPAAAPTAAPALTKAQQVDALVKAGKPVDLFAAYKLVRDCASARELAGTAEPSQRAEWKTPTPAEACGDITNAQSTSHIQWLDVAATAGVRGAALAYMVESRHEATDEAFVKHVYEVFDAGAKNGDAYSLLALSNKAEDEKDWPKALMYWAAANEVRRKEKGKDSPHNENLVNKYAQFMTPDQRIAAIESGKRLASGSHQ